MYEAVPKNIVEKARKNSEKIDKWTISINGILEREIACVGWLYEMVCCVCYWRAQIYENQQWA
jgi:hypothetical protein